MIDLRHFTLALCIAATCQASPLEAAEAGNPERYISDRLTVPLRSGPTNGHRIIHRGLPAGTKLTIIDRDPASKYVQIRTSGGTEGWLEEQYLDSQPTARQQLRTAAAELERVQAAMTTLQNQLRDVQESKVSAEQTSAVLQDQVAALRSELTELKAISGNAIAEHEENRKLLELNESLRSKVTDLADEREALRADAQQRLLLVGAGLVLLGLFLGVIIKARPRRSAWS